MLILLFLLTLSWQAAARQPQTNAIADERSFVASGNGGAVSCGHPLAAAAALQILRDGGNAIDAAVCAGFMLGVVDFTNSGLGGDGFVLIHLPNGQVQAWDASVKRPRYARSREIVNHIGLPTVPELLLKLRRLHGSRSAETLLQPAVKAARNGFKLSAYLEKTIEKSLVRMRDQAAIAFLAPDGYPIRAGQVLKQPLLAATLAELGVDDGRSFYRGKTAEMLINNMQAHGSEYRISDLALFRSRAVRPVRRDWHNYAMYGVPPPASSIATIKLAEDLLSSNLRLQQQKAEDILATAKIGRKILQARYSYISHCLREPYRFIELANNIKIKPSDNAPEEGNTTHLCVVDKQGMLVSITLTLGSHFGTGQFSPAGFFYNNGLRNFTDVVSDYPDDYPLNAGPVSAKSPILVARNGRPVLAIGGAGSERIVMNTGLTLARFLQNPEQPNYLLSQPRYFLDYRHKLWIEWCPENTAYDELKRCGLEVRTKPGCDDYFGLLSAIIIENDNFKALADPRRDGCCAAFDQVSP